MTRIKVVGSFEELISTPFEAGVNALCWKRTLAGSFQEIVQGLGPGEEIVPVDESRLRALSLSEDGKLARAILLEDWERLQTHDLLPGLDVIYSSRRDESGSPVPTDVSSFHVDSATVPVDTYLCSYVGAASEGLGNDQACRHVDIPETRAALLRLFDGEDDDKFAEFLSENYYDLHYAPLAGAEPFSFGLGNLWRIATEHPGCPVPPCIHRAPLTSLGMPPRLLLIS
ncbi:MAG: hypothetical protein WEB60_02450 [Terrimicrobiaceae bacterium]